VTFNIEDGAKGPSASNVVGL
ncbi:cold-shock protein, partial [Morganella morganii]|nr:cold-shock protein [Morganella morganii]